MEANKVASSSSSFVSSIKVDDSPIRHILCVKRGGDVRRVEETDDCFILDFDPFEDSPSELNGSPTDGHCSSLDLVVLSEKGQVACRDYPHPRHLCQKFPFATSSHEKHCELCYCYACDLAAPCRSWLERGHCNASEYNEKWKLKRKEKRRRSKENVK